MIIPVILDGYVQWVRPYRLEGRQPAYLFGEDFGSAYCPVQFEVCHDAV